MGCGDVRLLRTSGGVDFTGQEHAALNKLTMPWRAGRRLETHGSVVAVALPVPSSPATLAGIIGAVNLADSASKPAGHQRSGGY